MNGMSRRDALRFVPTLGLCTVAATTPGGAIAEEGGKQAPQREVFVVGPYPLGDLYRRYKDKDSIGDCFKKGAGPGDDDIVKSFNDCRLYVIDQRVRGNEPGWQFAEYKDGYPKLAAEGKLVHPLHDQGKKDFVIALAELEPMGTHTVESTEVSPSRSFHVTVGLKISGTLGLLSVQASYNLCLTRCIAYDVMGRLKPV
jgi:hypothetical protein